MGNPDLIIIINGIKVIKINGNEYSGYFYDEAIKLAIERHRQDIKDILKIADFPEQIDDTIKKIEVFEI